jgi:hypothetical protein
MKELHQLVKSLNEREVKAYKRFFNLDDEGEEATKKSELFNIIREHNVRTDREACKRIYGTLPNSAFSHLKKRVRDDILNTLLLLDKTEQAERTDFSTQLRLCSRYILEAWILFRKGLVSPGVQSLKRARHIAYKYDLNFQKVYVNDLLRAYFGYNYGLDIFKKLTDELNKELDSLQKLITAKELNEKVFLPNMFFKNKINEYKEYARQTAETLKQYSETSESANLKYQYWQAAIYNAEINNDYQSALVFASEMLEGVKTIPGLHSNARLSNGYLQIANVQLHLQQFAEAEENLQASLKVLRPVSVNVLISLEYSFLCNFHLGNFEVCNERTERAFNHPRFKTSEFTIAKWQYYKAALEFVQKRYNNVFPFLSKDSLIKKDSSGWLLGHKLLEIMTLIELKDFEKVDFRVESLRQLLFRNKDKKITRAKACLQILSTFVRTGYEWKRTLALEAKLVTKLEKAEGDYEWSPTSFEVTRFEKWLTSKK